MNDNYNSDSEPNSMGQAVALLRQMMTAAKDHHEGDTDEEGAVAEKEPFSDLLDFLSIYDKDGDIQDTPENRMKADKMWELNRGGDDEKVELPSVIRSLGMAYTTMCTDVTSQKPTKPSPSSLEGRGAKNISKRTSNKKTNKKKKKVHAVKTNKETAVLTHYTAKPWKLRLPPPVPYDSVPRNFSQSLHKPVGLWLSDDSSYPNWKSWCEGEEFRLDRLAYKTEVLVDLSDNVLLLDGSSVESVEAFQKKYGMTHQIQAKIDDAQGVVDEITKDIGLRKLLLDIQAQLEPEDRLTKERELEICDSIARLEEKLALAVQNVGLLERELQLVKEYVDWKAVARDYKGILVSPYDRYNFSFLGRHHHLMWFSGWDCASACIWDLTCVVKPKTKPSRPTDVVAFRDRTNF